MSWEKNGRDEKLVIWRDNMEVDKFIYSAGIAGSTFIEGLARKKLVGSRCPVCGRVFLPPSSYCEYDFAETVPYEINEDPFIELVITINYDDEGELLKDPVKIGLARFKGVTGGLLVRVEGDLKSGSTAKIKEWKWPLTVG